MFCIFNAYAHIDETSPQFSTVSSVDSNVSAQFWA